MHLQDENPLLPLPGLLRMSSEAALSLKGVEGDSEQDVLEAGASCHACKLYHFFNIMMYMSCHVLQGCTSIL